MIEDPQAIVADWGQAYTVAQGKQVPCQIDGELLKANDSVFYKIIPGTTPPNMGYNFRCSTHRNKYGPLTPT